MEKIDFKKQLGQNFIFDTNLLDFIVKSAGVTENDKVIEIGAGAGTLSGQLALYAKQVISFEIDISLKERLLEVQGKHNNLEFVFQDFMEADLNKYLDDNANIRVVANIPYYITTPIIFKLLEFSDKIKSMSFMVQKEVAERFCAEHGSRMYGITSIILQSVADVKYIRTIKKECFTPVPKVDSALIRLDLNLKKFNILNIEFFNKLIHNSFAMRRKTLINNLLKSYDISREEIENLLAEIGYNPMARPEEISVEKFVEFSNLLCKKLKNNCN